MYISAMCLGVSVQEHALVSTTRLLSSIIRL